MTSIPELPQTPATDEDTGLMLQFRDGSTDAFERLVRRNQDRVFKLARRYLSDPGRAEDVTQEVFVRVYQSAPAYKPTAKFTTWLYRITCNLCLNALRDGKVRGEVSLSGVNLEDKALEPAELRDPAERLGTEELTSAINAALAALPESQRTALILRRYEELSYQEIAEAIGGTVSGVKSLLSRARQSLRESLKQHL